MLFDWSGFMPELITSGVGMFGLGPYFNLLPIITIFLFIWQQKMFMPPAMDEQQAMQQKMMKYMMVFFGILFFKVAAGLCLYFIATSLWSVAERKLLPKTEAAPPPSKEAPKDWKQARRESGKTKESGKALEKKRK
jgi:YidC/Oxa1 family membrane protein insertase